MNEQKQKLKCIIVMTFIAIAMVSCENEEEKIDVSNLTFEVEVASARLQKKNTHKKPSNNPNKNCIFVTY